MSAPAFWRGRRVLLTGHTGFKGAWLSLWLEKLGARPMSLGLDLQGGVHFQMQVDQKAALDKRLEATTEDLRVLQLRVVAAVIGTGAVVALAVLYALR